MRPAGIGAWANLARRPPFAAKVFEPKRIEPVWPQHASVDVVVSVSASVSASVSVSVVVAVSVVTPISTIASSPNCMGLGSGWVKPADPSSRLPVLVVAEEIAARAWRLEAAAGGEGLAVHGPAWTAHRPGWTRTRGEKSHPSARHVRASHRAAGRTWNTSHTSSHRAGGESTPARPVTRRVRGVSCSARRPMGRTRACARAPCAWVAPLASYTGPTRVVRRPRRRTVYCPGWTVYEPSLGSTPSNLGGTPPSLDRTPSKLDRTPPSLGLSTVQVGP